VGLNSLKSLNLTNGYPNKNKNNKNKNKNKNNKVKSKPLELRSRVTTNATHEMKENVIEQVQIEEIAKPTTTISFSKNFRLKKRCHFRSTLLILKYGLF
jgi:hypothetical protein